MASSQEMERTYKLLEGVLTTPVGSSILSMRAEKRSSVEDTFLDESMMTTATFSKISKIRASDLSNLSITINPDEISKLWEIDNTETIVTSADLDNLYQQFQEAVELHGNTQHIFDAISDFVEACSVTIESMREKGFQDRDGNDFSWLINERNTWRLVYGLYRDRLLHQDEEEVDLSRGLEPYEHPMSEKEAMLELYKNESSVRECQLIVDWLERVSREDWAVGARVGHCTDRTVAWENTLHQLENTEVPYMSSRELVTALDPDAPTRQRGSLHDLDIEDESRLLEQVFFEIRRGCLDKAQELCVHCGQAWRAAILEGWRLHHDPNYRRKEQNEKLPIEGNPYRDVWKLCAWRLCEDDRAPVKARATMGALCGHLDALLSSCSSWEDILWARARVAVDRRVERAVRDAVLRKYVPMPDKYWDNVQLSLQEIFREMRGTEVLTEECEKPDRVVQELISMDKAGELTNRMAAWAPVASPQFLRFLAHLVIVLRLVGRSVQGDAGDSVITSYAKVLMKEGDPKLIAFYVAMLPEEDHIDLYATFMESITDFKKREQCLKAAENCNLNIKTITKRVVQNIRNRAAQVEENEETLSKGATEADLQKISALEWVVFYPDQRADAIWQANILIRNFIAHGKLDCARLAFNKMPSNSIESIINQYNCKVDETLRVDLRAMPPKINATLREYLCLKAYLDAQEGFSDWFHNFHNTKPTPPYEPEEGDIVDKLALEHKQKQYSHALDRWKMMMEHQAKAVKSQLYNVIIFPDEGWLIDNFDDDEVRKNQLQTLRNFCLPQIVMLLHTVLHSMEEYEECLDLASLIMNEKFGIYKTFTQHQLKDLMVKMAESSTGLLGQCGDPFGDCGPDDEHYF